MDLHRFPFFILFILLGCSGSNDGAKLPDGSSKTGGSQNTAIGIFHPRGNPKNYRIAGQDVAIYPEAHIQFDEGYDLILTGAGVGQEKVAIKAVDVSVTAHYMTRSFSLSPTDPLKGIAASPSEAIVLTLLRDVSAEDIQDSFYEALVKNGIATNHPMVSPLLSNLESDVKQGTQIVFVSVARGTDEAVALYSNDLGISASVHGQRYGTLFWKIWFGTPVDDASVALKQELIGTH